MTRRWIWPPDKVKRPLRRSLEALNGIRDFPHCPAGEPLKSHEQWHEAVGSPLGGRGGSRNRRWVEDIIAGRKGQRIRSPARVLTVALHTSVKARGLRRTGETNHIDVVERIHLQFFFLCAVAEDEKAGVG